MGGFNPWHHYPTRAISPGSAPWCESGGYVVVLAVGSVSTAAKKVEFGRGTTLSTEMRVPWGKLGALSHKINPLGALSQSHHQQGPTADAVRNGHQTARNVDTTPTTSTHAIPGAPKSRWNIRSSSKRMKRSSSADKTEAQPQNGNEVKVDIVEEENSDLLGGIVMTGTLALPGKLIHKNVDRSEVTAKLTTKAFLWSLRCLCLDDIVAVSCYNGSKRFTIHSFTSMRTRWVPKAFGKERRSRSDLHFYGSTPDEALGWVAAFAQQGCYVNFLPNPNPSKKGSAKEDSAKATVKCRASPQMLVVLNPKSGRGLARKVFRKKVQPILELAGFKLTIVETTGARHAQNMAMQLDLSTCPDGIICVGGDGIINEVLNGLLGRHDAARASTIPIGIIPAGSDNSLVWTILGVKDATTAALAIVKGGTVATDVFTVEWEKTGATHLGHTVTYYGFMSDVLELSAKYQGRFGPLRYFVAGAIRLLYLPKYKCEVRYIPAEDLNLEVKTVDSLENPLDAAKGPIYDSDTEIVVEPRQSNIDGMLPSSHSRIGSEIEFFGVPTDAANEPSDYVRGLDYKAKRSPSENRYSSPAVLEEVIAVHPLGGGASPSPRSRSRSKSRSDCGSGLSAMTPDMIRSSRSSPQLDKYETGVGGSCLGDNIANSVGRRWGPLEGVYDPKAGCIPQIEPVFRIPSEHHQTDDEWVVKQGPFLGVMICNHECKTVQCLESQAMAPTAEYDDGTLDLLLVRCVGRFQLLRFILAMQFNRHLSLPFVEYIKVKKVMLIPNKKGHLRCGIDGELLTLDGPITTSILPYQCQLIGSPRKRS